MSLDDAYKKISDWVQEYNHFRPHSSLNGKTPAEVVEQQLQIKQTENKNKCLPAAPLSEAMYFAAAGNASASSENTYLHKEVFTSSKTPKSPT